MGRASQADAARHREDVVTATSKLLRERGAAGTSVQDLMSKVGLTHGGFYKHFSSKDQLLGVAAEAAFRELLADLSRILANSTDRPRARDELLESYLTVEHRDDPSEGCAVTALASDAARASAESPLRLSYLEGLEKALDLIAELEEPGRPGAREAVRDTAEQADDGAYRRAIVDFSTMVGALTLARATGRTPLSQDILRVVRESLEAPQSSGSV
jgi:TetR/AcrR family transcriptional repressor of nem operon